jgi:hypothetical protein
MRKITTAIAAVLLIIAVLAAASCSSSNFADSAPNRNFGGYAGETSSPGNWDFGWIPDVTYGAEAMGIQLNLLSDSVPADTADFSRKIIRNASVRMVSGEAAEMYDDILAYARTLGGYEFSQNTFTNNAQTTINAVIKIAPGHLDAFIAFMREIGEVTSFNISSDDITDEFYDTVTRLETLQRSLGRYYEFLAAAETISDMTLLENQIRRLTGDIETMQGRINRWNALISESTVNITISQRAGPLDRRQINWSALSLSDMGYLIRSGFMTVINVIFAIIQYALVFTAAASPALAVAGVIAVITVRKRRRLKRMKEAADESLGDNGKNGESEKEKTD